MIVFLEDRIERLTSFARDERSSLLLSHSQVKGIWLFDVGDPDPRERIFSHAFKPYACIAPYGDPDRFTSLITSLHAQNEVDISLYKDFGIPETQNIIDNFCRITGPIRHGASLRNAYANIPAVICGAGPSLRKYLPVLGKVAQRVALFAGGSAMDLLYEAAVPFLFGGIVDPRPPEEKYRHLSALRCPLFFQPHASHTLLARAGGPLICMGGSGAFPVEEWIAPGLKPRDTGFHVGTFLISVAEYLGFSPVILVGMEGYSEKGEEDKERDRIAIRGRGGHPALSRIDFILGSAWIERLSKTHPRLRLMHAEENVLKHLLSYDRPVPPPTLREEVTYDPRRIALFYESIRSVRASSRTALSSPEKLLSFDETLLAQEPFFHTVLRPLRKVWGPLLRREEGEGEMEERIGRLLFYARVAEEYATEIVR